MSGGRPPAWIAEAHGAVWDLRAFRYERGVWAVRHEDLPAGRAGTRLVVAPTWRELGARLDDEARFDAACDQRIARARCAGAARP